MDKFGYLNGEKSPECLPICLMVKWPYHGLVAHHVKTDRYFDVERSDQRNDLVAILVNSDLSLQINERLVIEAQMTNAEDYRGSGHAMHMALNCTVFKIDNTLKCRMAWLRCDG